MTITEFLTARLDEDQAELDAGDDYASLNTDGWMGHAAMWDRGRSVAEVAAKRAIVAEYVEAEAYYRAHADAPAGELTGLGTAVRLLAQPYAEHADFDLAWRV